MDDSKYDNTVKRAIQKFPFELRDNVGFVADLRQFVRKAYSKLSQISERADVTMEIAYAIFKTIDSDIKGIKKHNLDKYEMKGIQKHNLDNYEMKLAVEATFVVLVAEQGCRLWGWWSIQPQLQDNTVSFFNDYEKFPEFGGLLVDSEDIKTCTRFRYNIKILQILLKKPRQGHYLDLCTRLSEHKPDFYVTGSGNARGTNMRLIIYHRETGVCPTPRKKRGVEASSCSSENTYKRIGQQEYSLGSLNSEVAMPYCSNLQQPQSDPQYLVDRGIWSGETSHCTSSLAVYSIDEKSESTLGIAPTSYPIIATNSRGGGFFSTIGEESERSESPLSSSSITATAIDPPSLLAVVKDGADAIVARGQKPSVDMIPQYYYRDDVSAQRNGLSSICFIRQASSHSDTEAKTENALRLEVPVRVSPQEDILLSVATCQGSAALPPHTLPPHTAVAMHEAHLCPGVSPVDMSYEMPSSTDASQRDGHSNDAATYEEWSWEEPRILPSPSPVSCSDADEWTLMDASFRAEIPGGVPSIDSMEILGDGSSDPDATTISRFVSPFTGSYDMDEDEEIAKHLEPRSASMMPLIHRPKACKFQDHASTFGLTADSSSISSISALTSAFPPHPTPKYNRLSGSRSANSDHVGFICPIAAATSFTRPSAVSAVANNSRPINFCSIQADYVLVKKEKMLAMQQEIAQLKNQLQEERTRSELASASMKNAHTIHSQRITVPPISIGECVGEVDMDYLDFPLDDSFVDDSFDLDV